MFSQKPGSFKRCHFPSPELSLLVAALEPMRTALALRLGGRDRRGPTPQNGRLQARETE
jgi:hypothetical protein